MSRVVIVQRALTHYRVPFFERLRELLAADGIELTLVIGQTSPAEEAKAETTTLPWATVVENRYLPGPGRLVWQPALGAIKGADLVVVEQANRLLLTQLLQVSRLIRRRPLVTLWGHGANWDPNGANRLGEWWKRRALRACDWWFAYTPRTVATVTAAGFPAERVTDVQNAVDTRSRQAARAALDPAVRTTQRADLGSAHVGVVLGSLYERKRLPFLIEAADAIRSRIEDFALLVIGDGPDRSLVEAAAATRPWLRVLGTRHGTDLVEVAAAGDVLLNPGLVGLGIVDSFALELPMVTCDLAYHSPEIAYLEPGANGILLPADTSASAYGRVVADLLTDDDRRSALASGCRRSAATYTVESMAQRFAEGIRGALESGR